ncbi:MAG: alpha-glucosidase [Oscillospiraceae bacterium]|nr:alpha-glucosidase [Clostridiaceae bacterium]MDY5949261.1 alpha-glucosidase [Oscillospiraceae bacterium]
MAEIKKSWYKEMSVYQIWPRSFYDGNGDGIGDIKGVMEKLDYIKSLGVDAIWFSPLYKSPQHDYGYDIADYKSINPEYGTLEEFKELLDAAHAKGLKVIMDLVINHTSDEHQWFIESKKSKDNPYHDYYFWRKGKKPNGKKPPNNWLSTFTGPGWEYDENLDEWYLHLFCKEQPDLNMDNPKVREEIKDIIRFWLDMGVDGFREDVITFISKKEGLPNGFPIPAACGMEHYKCGPNLDKYLGEFREVTDQYDCMTVGEAPMMTPKLALRFIKEGAGQKLNMMFNFQHMEADCFMIGWIHTPFNLRKLKRVYNNWQTKLYGIAWNANYIENHDQPRIISRYGNEKYRVESGKMLATMYICQSGTPFIYQGQEIGMTSIRLPEIDMYKDVQAKDTYKLFRKLGFSHKFTMKTAMYASRDNARTPVQWTGGKNAGFTTADEPWFYINQNYTEVNVEAAEKDENSILNYYRKLLKFRKENEICIYGDFKLHYKNSRKLFVYERNYEGKRMLVINSFVEQPVCFSAPAGFDLSKGKLVLSNYEVADNTLNSFMTKPYETRVYLFE